LTTNFLVATGFISLAPELTALLVILILFLNTPRIGVPGFLLKPASNKINIKLVKYLNLISFGANQGILKMFFLQIKIFQQ